jgi:lambda family phage tail tape measure protein
MREALQAFKDQLAEEEQAITNSRSVLQAEMSAKLITLEDYYARQRVLMTRDTAAQETALQGQIAVLKNRTATGKDAIEVQRQLGQLETHLGNVRAKAVADSQVLAIQEKTSLDARREASEGYARAQDLATRAVEDQWQAIVDRISLGDEEYAQTQRITDITRKYADEIARLQILKAQNPGEAQRYADDIAAAQTAMDAQVAAVQNGYADMLAAQGDWHNGVSKGWADWAAQAKDVAGQVAHVTMFALDRMTDAIVEFALTGKLNFKQMLADILTEIVKFMAKQAVLQFMTAVIGSFAPGGASTGGVGTTATGAGFSTYAAKGGAWDTPALSHFSNTIVDEPTRFFAKGGVMGEAGPEAIMPLGRASDGNLGVRMIGLTGTGGGGGVTNITINTTVNSDGSSTTETHGDRDEALKAFGEQMRATAQEEIRKAMMQGGTLWRAGVGAMA